MIQREVRKSLTFIVDTSDYAGNFERELFAFLTGMADAAGEDMHPMAAPFADGAPAFPEELFDERVVDPGDDGIHRAYVTIVQSPGTSVYNSVGIFLARRPTPEEITLLRDRALAFPETYRASKWGSPIAVTGVRLIEGTVTKTESEIPLESILEGSR